MQTIGTYFRRAAVLSGVLVLTACGAGTATTGTSGTPTAPSAKATATATVVAKPTSAPQLTRALCQGIMTLAQVNQIVDPSDPAVALVVTTSDPPTCGYQDAQSLNVFFIVVQTYAGPYPVTATQFSSYAAQLASGFTKGGGTITSNTPMSGVGDHAVFLAESPPTQSTTIKVDSLIALDGKVVFACANYSVGSSPDATQLSALTQCGQRVVSQL